MMIDCSEEDSAKIALVFFNTMQMNSLYTDLPDRPIQELEVGKVYGVLPDTAHISEEKGQEIRSSLMRLIKTYVSKEVLSH